MSAEYTTVFGLGINLGTDRPAAVFGRGSEVADYQERRKGYSIPVERMGHINTAYSDNGEYFLIVTGTGLRFEADESVAIDTNVEASKIQDFKDWCRGNGIPAKEPRWLVATYCH